ncbi:MAG: Fic family protein [Bacteroidetes bacterium]|nr:Fic family protein [Bacteroidota bacterium]
MKNYISGNYINQGSYKSFQPNLVNQAWQINDMKIIDMLSKADRAIGRLDMYSEYIPNIDLFVSMHVLKEATKSSRIEGTQTNIEDAILEREDVTPEKRDDWEEVHNYTIAMGQAIESLKELPFSNRLIKNVHKKLLRGVRGMHKEPGNFRKSQNWIGGASINDAVFVPPNPSSVPDLMSDLEKFCHNEEFHIPNLLKIAILHYQFETIHPFLDGNGRVGRLLIPLFLVSKKILKNPVLYLSDFFEKNRTLYYDNLMLVREKNNLSQWFKFFLTGITETCNSSIETFDKILQLEKKSAIKIQSLRSRAANAQKVINDLYQRPIINVAKVSEITGLSVASAYKLIEELEKIQILREITGSKRGKQYVYDDYLKLFL